MKTYTDKYNRESMIAIFLANEQKLKVWMKWYFSHLNQGGNLAEQADLITATRNFKQLRLEAGVVKCSKDYGKDDKGQPRTPLIPLMLLRNEFLKRNISVESFVEELAARVRAEVQTKKPIDLTKPMTLSEAQHLKDKAVLTFAEWQKLGLV